MRLSQFHELLAEEFGDFGSVLLSDLRLTELGDQTPSQALASGIEPRLVWQAMCHQQQVPKERWHGRAKAPRHAE